MHFSTSPLPALAALVFAVTVQSKPEQIRGVSSPIFHYYLQANPQDATMPVMGPESSGEYYNIDGGAIQSVNSSAYLTIAESETSYKTLTLSPSSSSAPGWTLEGDTIITGTSSSWGRQLNFLVCQVPSGSGGGGGMGGDLWQVYLQTGSETPAGRQCSNFQSLHLPCLC
ncbi:hypothetical protein F4808DRAFT_409643 [Astrocystis sublimbata]|nr:hypothetical protein F4808DRAFT_409643 [Astrocystis sublimbata]